MESGVLFIAYDYRISYTPYTLVKFEYKGYNGIKDKF